MAENTANNNTANNNEPKGGNRAKKLAKGFIGIIFRHPLISIILIAIIIAIIVAGYRDMTIKRGKENPNDPKNGPAAASGFINNVYIDENGKLRTEKTIRELWNELKQKGNTITEYFDSAEELAKLLSAAMATDYPDTRKNPDEPIDWSKYDINIDSTEVQGIVKFKRALSTGKTITMTYLPQSEFQEKISKYNESGKVEDREEAMKYFTLEKTYDSSSSSSSLGSDVDVGSRPYNNNTFNVENIIDVVNATGDLGYGKRYEAVQSGCFDGKYYICAMNKWGDGEGKIIWINSQTKKIDYKVIVGSECGHMEGMTYDSNRKVLLIPCDGQKHLLQIDNQTKSIMSSKYVSTPDIFGKLAYSVTRQQLIALERHHKQLVFMNFDGNQYVEKGRVNLSFTSFINVQGIASDGQVVFLSDTSETGSDKYRVYAFDYQGNKVEEHSMGSGFKRNSKEAENCCVDKDGNLILFLPHMIAKVKDYKAHPVDWENNYSAVPSSSGTSASTGSFSKVEEILKYACSWVGKVKYGLGKHEELREGAKASCSGLVFRVYEHFGLMNKHKSAKEWEPGVPGVEEVKGGLANASPGDILWRKGSDDCHVSIYLGKGKRVHSTPGHNGVNIADIDDSAVHKIFHFTGLPKDPNAYFDTKTGILHTSSGDASSSTTSSTSTTSTTSNIASSSSSASGQDIVNEAEKYVGKLPYAWGGYSLETGADCSGFCWAILHKLGLYTGKHIWTVPFETKGEEVSSLAQAQAGDMIIYGPAKGESTHMAIYDGKGGVIHETDEKGGCKHTNDANFMKILTIRRFVNSSSTAIAYNNDVFNVDKNARIYAMQGAPVPKGDKRTYRATQSACFDGKYIIYAQNKNEGSTETSNNGGRIAWIDLETGKFVTSVDVGKEGGHMDGVAYDSDRNMVLKPSSSKEGNLLQIDNNTKATSHTSMSKYCNKLTYVSTIHQLVGLDGGKLHFMTYKEEQNKYVKEKEVKLENYKTYSGAQGIGTDGQCIYVADSNKANGAGVDPSKFRVWVYTLDGKQVGEHLLDKSLGSREREVESAFGDNNGNLWLVCPDYFEKVTNYKTNAVGSSSSATPTTGNATFKVKVATWQETTTKVESETNPEENRSDPPSHNMSEITIPYQSAIAQYRMPFNYLWAMRLIGQDKNFVFDLADLVRNSKIEITIHDNYNETTTSTTEESRTNYFYTGQANAKFDYAYSLEVPGAPIQPDIMWQSKTLDNIFTATAKGHEDYKKTTTITNKTNTLDIALTLADVWCVKYEKKYKFNGKDGPHSSTSIQELDDEEGDTDVYDKITNSTLKNQIISSATTAAYAWMSGQPIQGIIKQPTIIHNDNEKEKIECTITNQKITTTTTTTTSSYTGEPEKPEDFTEDEEGRQRFVDVFNKHYKARSNILSVKDWLFKILESNADTVNMVDLTKYLIYRATGTTIDRIVTYKFSVYDLTDFNDASGSSSGTIYGNSFEEKVWYTLSEKYSEIAAAGAMGNFAQESGFKANNLQNTYETSLGYSDISYTAAVNNGSYSRDKFVNDSAGYGLAQWTFWSRKAALYDFAKQEGTGIDSEETQIKFLLKEIETHCTKWQKSTSVSEAAVNFHNEFENSNDNESQIQERVRSAEELYKKYKGRKRPAYNGSFPRYYQSDSKWSSKRYGSDTIGEAGCGACALAMAVSGLTGKTVEPPEIVDYLNAKGISTAYEAEGTNGARAIAQKYGLKLQVVNKSNKSKIDEALDQGKVCMFSISSNGVYSGEAHYILCYKRDNNGYYIVESARYYDSNKPYSYEKTMGSSNNGGMVNILGK